MMSNNKATGSNNIHIKMRKNLRDRYMTKLFNKIMGSKQMLVEWRKKSLVSIYKKKGIFKIVKIIGV